MEENHAAPSEPMGLVLYQHLTGKAWIAAEELSVARLSTAEGLAYFTSWVTARFLDLEVARIGRAFSDFFRKLRPDSPGVQHGVRPPPRALERGRVLFARGVRGLALPGQVAVGGVPRTQLVGECGKPLQPSSPSTCSCASARSKA